MRRVIGFVGLLALALPIGAHAGPIPINESVDADQEHVANRDIDVSPRPTSITPAVATPQRSTPPQGMSASKLFLTTLAGTFAADAASTHYMLQGGAYEAVLTQNGYVNDAIIAGEAVAVGIGLSRWSHRHPTGALILGWTIVGVRGAVVAHNLDQIRRH
jgi:hypothetical protein